MRRRSPHICSSRAAVAAAVCLLMFSCGGSDEPIDDSLSATFFPASETPADGSVTLQAGEASGTTFEVRVSAKGIEDFFGAAFWIAYDNTAMAFRGSDDSTSFLRDGAAEVEVIVDAASQLGYVKVGIGRVQNQAGTVEGVDVTDARDLIVLTFEARKVTSGSSVVFADGHREVTDATGPPPNPITVTWAGGALVVI